MHSISLPLLFNKAAGLEAIVDMDDGSLLKAMAMVVAEVSVADMGIRKSLQLVSQSRQTDVVVPQRSDEVLLWILRDERLVPVGENLPHGPSVEDEVLVRAGVDEGPAHFRVKLYGEVSCSCLPDVAVVHSVQQCGVDIIAQKISDFSFERHVSGKLDNYVFELRLNHASCSLWDPLLPGFPYLKPYPGPHLLITIIVTSMLH